VSGSLSGSSFNVTAGPAKLVFSDNRVVSLRNLHGLSGKVKSFDGVELEVSGTIDLWNVAENVEVYTHTQASSSYVHATPDDAAAAFAAGKTLDFYYDDTPDGGGLIRVILIRG
jgi:hypothetical protein